MAGHQPYLYEPMGRQDNRFPQSTFDPKAITRASFEPRQPRQRHDGPLVSFNRHPDAHMVLTHRSNDYQSLSPRIKTLIKCLRVLQLALRVLQLIGAAGILTLYILMTNVPTVAAWILRIAPGVAVFHCSYGIYHMARRAGGRTPASSAAYQVFAGISDTCLIPIYAFGVVVVRGQGSEWSTRLSNPDLMQYFVPAAEYAALGCGILHLITLCVSVWLGVMFRKIALMPPDLNPLEDRFTTRAKHRRNKSSVATTATLESEKRLSTPYSDQRQSATSLNDVSRPPTIPFLRTRTNSGDSHFSRDSRMDLPSRQYQIVPSNASPRASIVSTIPRRSAAGLPTSRNSYTAVSSMGPDELPESPPSRPQARDTDNHPLADSRHRPAKFTETWCATDSLISRTQHRNRMLAKGETQRQHTDHSQGYEAVGGRYDSHEDGFDSEPDERDVTSRDYEADGNNTLHPEPLGSNPPRPRADRTNNAQADRTYDEASRMVPHPLHPRASFADRENGFFSKPYGQLKPATPPVMIGNGRQVSSGNDYAHQSSLGIGRRNVSGKVAEEGRAVQGRWRSTLDT